MAPTPGILKDLGGNSHQDTKTWTLAAGPMFPGGKAFHISLFIRSFTSSDPPLSTGEEPLSVSFPPSYTLHTFTYHNKVPDRPVTSHLPRLN